MPSRPGPLWLLTGLTLAGFPAVNFIYWEQVLRSGILPADGDSIAIAEFGSVLFTIVVSPVILVATWFCLRRYNPETHLLAWRLDRSKRSVIATLIFGTALTLIADAAFVDLTAEAPWYEFLWTGYFLLPAAWLLAMRAAVIEQLGDGPTLAQS